MIRWLKTFAFLSLTIFTIVGPASAQSDILQTLDRGEVLYKSGRYAEAEPHLEKVLQAIDAKTLAEQEYLGRCLIPLVEINLADREFEDALARTKRLLAWLDRRPENDSLPRLKLTYQVRLGDGYAGLGRMAAAQEAWRAAIQASRPERTMDETWRLGVAWRMLDPRTNPEVTREQRARFAAAIRAERKKIQAEKSRSSSFLQATELEALAFASIDEPAGAAEAYRARLQVLDIRAQETYLTTLVQLAVWERESGQFVEAEKRLRAALAEKRFATFAPAIWEQLGLTLKAAGTGDATECWRKLARLEEAAQATKQTPAQRRASLERLRLAHEELHEFDAALQAAESILASLEQTNAAPEATLRARQTVGTLAAATGDYLRARKQLQECLAVLRQDESRSVESLLTTLTALGNVYRKTGQGVDAEAFFREALELCQTKYQRGDLPLAEAQSNLAAVAAENGRYAEAIGLLREALSGAEKAGPRGAVLRAALLEYLAIAYLAQGQTERAAENLRASLAAEPARGDDQHARRSIERFDALARIELARRDHRAAATACEQAILLAKSAGLQNDPLFSRLERRAGRIALETHQTEEAKRHLLSALAAEQRRHANADAAKTLSDLADLAVARRDFDLAERRYREALQQQADIYDRPILHYNILGNLGQLLYYAKGEREEGLRLLKQAAELLEVPRAATTGGGERQRAEFLARHAIVFDLLVDNCLATQDVAGAFHYAELARNRTFLDQLQLAGVDLRETLPRDLAQSLNAREAELAAQLTTARDEAAKALATRPNDAANAELADRVRALQQEYAQVWGEIRDASPFYREVLARRLEIGNLRDVQSAAIAPGDLMLFYVLGEFQSHLLLVGHEPEDVAVFDLKLADEAGKQNDWLTRHAAADLVAEYLAALRSVEGGRGLAGVAVSPKGAMQADRGRSVTEVFLPTAVRKLIATRDPAHLIVVPDGALHELPLECLVISPGERPVFAIDTLPPLCYAPSATILLSLTQRAANEHKPSGPAILTVGNPKYGGPASEQSSTVAATRDAYLDLGGSLALLPGTESECRRAAQAFGHDASVLLLGDDATEAGVRAAIEGRTYLHLAAHGLVDERDDNLFGAIALTPPQTLTVDDDGFLALHEIHALKLTECELAALSACQTNVGADRPLEAGSTLARAFLAAGARRVVSSHWNVDDATGSELISTLWEEIAARRAAGERIDYATALRDAQRRVRQQPEYASAYYWAPFVLIGPPTGQ